MGALLSGLVRRGALLRVGCCIDAPPVAVEFRHARNWQLTFPGRAAGEVVRALAWQGLEKAVEAINQLCAKLPSSELKEVASARSRLATWMAQEVSALMTHA